MYKIKHLATQYVLLKICERIGCSNELTEFKCDTVIRCQNCNISSLLDIPPVDGFIAKWKRLGTMATLTQSVSPFNIKDANFIVCSLNLLRQHHQHKNYVPRASWVFMAELLHVNLTLPSTMLCQMEWSKAHHH